MTLAEGTPTTAAPAAQATPPCEIDILDPRFYDDPWDAYRWLRDHAPLHWDARNELWVVSRHEDVSPHLPQPGAVLRRRGRAPEGRRADVDHLDGRPRAHPPAPPDQPGLHARAGCAQLTDHIRELSNQIIDEVAERGRARLRRGLRHPRAADRDRRADGPRPRPAQTGSTSGATP